MPSPRGKSATPSVEAEALAPEVIAEYNRFVRGVQPKEVRLCSVTLRADRYLGGVVEGVVSERGSRWERIDGGFIVTVPLEVQGAVGKRSSLSLDLELAIEYESRAPMTEALFPLFAKVNVPVNVRPFLRETVGNLMLRVGWPPLVLPAFLRPERKGPAEEEYTSPASVPGRVAEGARRKKAGPK